MSGQFDDMPDPVLSAIYGTNGAEKVASVNDPAAPMTLSDLALSMVYDAFGEDDDFEKVASVHGALHQEFVEMDRAGRAIAQSQINEMEKAASEGDDNPLLEYLYGDAEEPEPEPGLSPVQQAIMAEIARRAGR